MRGPRGGSAYLACAAVAYRQGEFERAKDLLAHGECAAETAEPPVRVATALLQALALAAAGPRAAARGALKLRALRSTISQEEAPPDFLRLAARRTQSRAYC